METAGQLLFHAGAMTVLGTLLFQAVVTAGRRPRLLAVAVFAAVLGALLWLAGQAALFGGAMGDVLTGSWFGQTLAVQAGLVVVSAVLWGRAGRVAACLGVGLTAARGNGVAMGDSPVLTATLALHVLGAGAWIGSLPALGIALREGDDQAASACARLGAGAVGMLVLSALWQGWVLGGGLPGLIGTGYGAVLGLKGLILWAMLGLAWRHRTLLVPLLPRGRRKLIASIGFEAVLGLIAVAVAIKLGAMAPGMHAQPWWPFAWRLDGFAFDDPDLAREVIGGLGLVGLAVALVIAGVWQRWLWLGVPLALWLGVPHLDLLAVPAYPTSDWLEPEPPGEASVQLGDRLYAAHCASCHGVDRRGDGPAAAGLSVPPADLTAAHLWDHRDGELFWWLSDGMRGPDGARVMQGFAGVLDEAARWALIDAIRAGNPHKPSGASPGHHHMMMH